MLAFQGATGPPCATLVRRHQSPALFNFALQRTSRNGAAAEEVVQDAFVRGGAECGGLQARGSDHYLALHHRPEPLHRSGAQAGPSRPSVARRAAPGRRPGRRWSRRPHAGRADGRPDRERRAGGRLGRDPRTPARRGRGAPGRAARGLPACARSSNLPFKEIAEVVGVPENTVKSRMRYALERLQAALSDFEEYARALR